MKKCLIVSEKPWNSDLVLRLNRTIDEIEFELISQKEELTIDFLKQRNPEFVFFPHWSYIIPAAIYKSFECVVFHMTDLPFGRGGSPLQNLIVRGFEETKLSALKVVEAIDAGPIYLKKDLSLKGTAKEIFERTDLLIEKIIEEIALKKIEPIAQSGEVTNFSRRTPTDGKMNELSTLNEFYDYIRMLDAPTYPAAYIEVNGFKIEFSEADFEDENTLNAHVRITKK